MSCTAEEFIACAYSNRLRGVTTTPKLVLIYVSAELDNDYRNSLASAYRYGANAYPVSTDEFVCYKLARVYKSRYRGKWEADVYLID